MDTKELKTAGLKVTGPRLKILQIFETAVSEHLSAEDIYKQLLSNGQEISLATIYRVLTQFESAGLVNRHYFEGSNGTSAVFELAGSEHHDHIVCVKCGKVVEFYDNVIEQRQLDVAAKLNFSITDHTLCLYGICEDCNE